MHLQDSSTLVKYLLLRTDNSRVTITHNQIRFKFLTNTRLRITSPQKLITKIKSDLNGIYNKLYIVLCTRKNQLGTYKIPFVYPKSLFTRGFMVSTLKINIIYFLEQANVKFPIFINDLCFSYFLLVSGFFYVYKSINCQ